MAVTIKQGGQGYSLSFILFMILLTIKLTMHPPELSWFLVFLPIWLPAAIAVGILLIMFIVGLIYISLGWRRFR